MQFGDGRRDEHDRLILGDPDKGCGHCGAPPIETVAANGKAAWYHAPSDCCPARKARIRNATTRAAKTDYPPEAEPRRPYE